MANPTPHDPSKSTKNQVSTMVMAGIRQDVIADILDIDAKTLRKYYRKELDTAKSKVITTVASKLYDQCLGGNVPAMVFFLKTQGGWRDSTNINHTSEDGTMTPTKIERVVVDAEPDSSDKNA
jgi:hypothetical protein